MLLCDKCASNACCKMETGTMRCCPTADEEVKKAALAIYQNPEDYRLAYASAMTETINNGRNTRVEEIIAFCKYASYQKIGVTFCMCLLDEAKIFSSILRENGFEVSSIICKNGAFSKDVLDVEYLKEHSIRSEYAMCNPVGQALMMNREQVDLAVILGLCVGHDTLFMKHCDAPMTYLAVKDRCTGHNPLSPLYQQSNLFSRIHHVQVQEEAILPKPTEDKTR